MPQQPMNHPTNQGDVALFTAEGDYVTTVKRGAGPAPGIIQWGSRYFVRRYGAYREEAVLVSNERQR